MVWAVLIFDEFSIFRFSLFLRVSYLLPELADLSNLVAMVDLSKIQILLFLRASYLFLELAKFSNFVAMLDLSKLKILQQISLTRVGLFGAKILSTNHSTFPLPPPHWIPPPDSPWFL